MMINYTSELETGYISVTGIWSGRFNPYTLISASTLWRHESSACLFCVLLPLCLSVLLILHVLFIFYSVSRSILLR